MYTYKLVAVRKDSNGKITHFQTDRDTVISISEAMMLAESGEINSITSLREDGTWYIDEYGQQIEGHNLDQLPEF